MKPSSCASPSEPARPTGGGSFAFLVLLAVTCAGAAKPAPVEAPESEAANGSVVTLQFANGSSKASVSVDLSTTDVQLDMRTKARKDSAPAPVAPVPAAEAPRPASLPGTAATPAPTTAATDSVTRLVVAGIRRGQDLFLKGDLARAQTEIDATLALRPTAEARALAGSIAWVRGDKALARGHWQTALALDPSQPGVADMLARTEPGAAPEAGKATPR